MASFINGCVFTAASGGTGSFVVAAAVTGWQTPAQASAVNGATYRYRAWSADNAQWEIGTGVYTTATTTLTRATIEASTNGGAAVNFTSAPSVALTMFGADLVPYEPSTGVVTAAAFVPSGSSVPTDGLYLPGANTLGWAINSLAEMQLTATAFAPAADGGLSLGTTALGWQNLFGNTGFVFNFENGDWVATHSAGILTVGTGDLRVTTAGTDAASVVTVGGAQTLTNKSLTAPAIGAATGVSLILTGTSASIIATGRQGATDPALKVDASAASSATGVAITAAAAGSRAAIAAISSGTNEGLSVDAKGSGTIRLGATSTGDVEFSRNAVPTASDGVALGTTALMWSDLFLASGGVINWNNGNATLTHSASLLTSNVNFRVSKSSPSFLLNKTATAEENSIIGLNQGSTRWQVVLGNANAESGSNVGSDITWNRFSDAGSYIDTPFLMYRQTGLTAMLNGISMGLPVTKTADFTVADTENMIISNRAATNTATLPSAASYPGRILFFRTIQAQTVVSASSNVVPKIGGAAGTAILPATDGAWAMLVSDASNWQIMMSGT